MFASGILTQVDFGSQVASDVFSRLGCEWLGSAKGPSFPGPAAPNQSSLVCCALSFPRWRKARHLEKNYYISRKMVYDISIIVTIMERKFKYFMYPSQIEYLGRKIGHNVI